MKYRNIHPPGPPKDKTPFILIVVLFIWCLIVATMIIVIGKGLHDYAHANNCINPITDMEITLCTGDTNPADYVDQHILFDEEDEDAYTYPDVRDRD